MDDLTLMKAKVDKLESRISNLEDFLKNLYLIVANESKMEDEMLYNVERTLTQK